MVHRSHPEARIHHGPGLPGSTLRRSRTTVRAGNVTTWARIHPGPGRVVSARSNSPLTPSLVTPGAAVTRTNIALTSSTLNGASSPLMPTHVTCDTAVTPGETALALVLCLTPPIFMIAKGLVLHRVLNPSRSSKSLPKLFVYHDRKGSLVHPYQKSFTIMEPGSPAAPMRGKPSRAEARETPGAPKRGNPIRAEAREPPA
jgi:hypothetical protein